MAKSKAKIELGKLIMAHRTLEAYAKERVCVKLAYKIFLFRKKAAEHEEFFSSKVNGIIKECSLKDDAGKLKCDENGNALIDKAKVEECKKAIAEVENLKVEKPSLDFILEELSEIKMSVEDLARLEDFIREEE